jgi:proline iminopeptidase
MRTLYPEIEPFDTGVLEVDARHRLYYEQCGNPDGKPVVLLHGGPGAGCSAKMRRFHDPAKYRIVLFDQRGSGRSTPHADLHDNTTWDLVADIEKLQLTGVVDQFDSFQLLPRSAADIVVLP